MSGTPQKKHASAVDTVASRLAALRHNPAALKWLWLVLFVALVAPFKLQLSSSSHDPSFDGGYYTDVAQNVRDGNGLKTDISLYHQGYPYFPHPTSVYPLWPLLYGFAGKLFSIPEVGVWLSTAFYFLSLLLAFVWLTRIFPGNLFPRAFPGFQAAHVFVLMLGLNPQFFRFTSLPYTEGLAFVLVFGFLLRSRALWSSRRWWAGAEIGLWLALVFLARSQLLIMALAALSTFAWALLAVNQRRVTLFKALACIITAGLVVTPYWLYISSFLVDPGLGTMLRFDQAQATSSLSLLPMSVQTDGIFGYLTDRASGFAVAFAFGGKYSYRNLYALYQYSVPLAALLMAAALAARIVTERFEPLVHSAWAWLRRRENLHLVFVVVFALGCFLSLHTIHHAAFIRAWVFAARPALMAVFLFYLALLWLLRTRTAAGVVLGVVLLASSVVSNATSTYELAERAANEAGNDKLAAPRLVAWLNAERAKREKLTVAVPILLGQQIVWRTPGVGYHWTYNRTTSDELAVLVDELGADLIVVGKQMKSWPLRRPNKDFTKRYELVADKLSGFQVWAPKGPRGAGRAERGRDSTPW